MPFTFLKSNNKQSLSLSGYGARRKIVSIAIVAAILLTAFIVSQVVARSTHADSINTTDFVTTWRVAADDTTITIPTYGSGYNYSVDWDNDGTPDQTSIKGDVTHDFGAAGDYTIRISGNFPRIDNYDNYNNSQKLIDINQWGDIHWSTMEYAFSDTSLGNISATDSPDLGDVTNMAEMFSNASSFNGDLSGWDVSNITDMRWMFYRATAFNGDISDWDVSNVTITFNMFAGGSSFNGDLSRWGVSSVTDMTGMFAGASSFDGDLSSWNVGSVVSMDSMLSYSGLSMDNYDKTLAGWASQEVNEGVSLGANGLVYCDTTARNQLVNIHGWQISGDTECETPGDVIVMIDDSAYQILYFDSSVQANQDLGELSVYGPVQEGIEYSLGCNDETSDSDEYFTIDSQNHLKSLRLLEYQEGASNTYTVCIKATKDYGGGRLKSSETVITIELVGKSSVSGVNFSVDGGRDTMTVSGSNFRGPLDDNAFLLSILTSAKVVLNGETMPFCTDESSGLTREIYLQSGADPDLVSDGPGCYYFLSYDENYQLDFHFTDNEVSIWLPDNFDTAASGTVSINGSSEFAYNQSGGGDDTPGDNDKVTARVEGQTLKKGEVEIIPKRPTFSGTAPAHSAVKVTVHSDPVSCETTADADGKWSCTLPESLEPGLHTVRVVITTPDDQTIVLEDYSVRVDGQTDQSDTISGHIPGVPNAGTSESSTANGASHYVVGKSSASGIIVATATLMLIIGGSLFYRHKLSNRR